MNGIGIIPTRIRIQGTHRIPLDAFRTFTPMGNRRFATSTTGTPELEPELASDEGLGVQEDGPRRPLPLAEVLTNVDWLALRSPDPVIHTLAREYDLIEYLDAQRAYAAWEVRQ
jgi:hypothetical protein